MHRNEVRLRPPDVMFVLTTQTSRVVTATLKACAGSSRVVSLLIIYEEWAACVGWARNAPGASCGPSMFFCSYVCLAPTPRGKSLCKTRRGRLNANRNELPIQFCAKRPVRASTTMCSESAFGHYDRSYAPATWHGDPTQAIHGSFKAVAADGLACRRLATKHSASGLR